MSGYSAPGFYEKKIERETAARVAAFLGGLGRGSENPGATGVRSDWWERTDLLLWYLFYREIRVIDIEWHVKKCHISIDECCCLKAGRFFARESDRCPVPFFMQKNLSGR